MNKILLLFLTMLCGTSLNAAKMRNGAFAHEARIKQIWKAVHKTQFYSDLLTIAIDCKAAKTSAKAIDWYEEYGFTQGPLKLEFDKSILEWTKLGILRNGILDTETQEIILVTYFNDREPIWGEIEPGIEKQFATPIFYPIVTWVEKVPGHTSYLVTKRTVKVFGPILVTIAKNAIAHYCGKDSCTA